jgi:serine/threonine protein kinase/tetratricopeptide (TPR) repeat protein
MSPAETVFFAALALDDPARRAAYLDEACGANVELRRRVDQLLAAHPQVGSFLQEGPTADRVPSGNGGGDATIDVPIPERPGTVIGPYKLLEQIGEGGFGVVFLAEQTQPVRRKVALKVLKPGMDTRQVVARFEAERQALAIMDNPNIAKVFDGGMTPSGRPYFVMELVKGTPITEFCDQNHLTPRQRLELFVHVCHAVQHAHQKGVIHRDLKPSNVLVTVHDTTPVVKVIDFGVAKALGQELTDKTLFTGFAQMVGTPLYMSPEQAGQSGLDVDTRSDVYSLGVLLYELLTGTTPFGKERFRQATYEEIRRIIREEEPPKPSTRLSDSKDSLPSVAAQRHTEPARLTKLVRGELDWIVMKALEKDRDRRYETANGFAADVLRYFADEAVLSCPPSAGYGLRKFTRRNKAAMSMAAMFTLALLIAVAALSVGTVLTSRAYAAEKKAHLQSEANLELTRKAIDEFFTKVSQSKLLDVPGLQPLRKDLLESAVRFQVSLAADRPDDPTVRADLAAAHLRLAVSYFEVDRNDDCQASLKAGLDEVENLRRDYPRNRELCRRVAGYYKALRPTSAVTAMPKDIPGMTQVLQRYTSLWEQMADDDPETLAFRFDLAAIYAFRADFFGQTQGREKGVADCRRSIALTEDLLRQRPDEPEYLALLAFTHRQLAGQLKYTGQESISALEKSLELQERLVGMHGDVPQYRKDLLESLLMKARRLREQGKGKEFELLTQRLAGELEKLADEYPSAAGYRIDLASALKELAKIAASAGRNGDAEKLLRRALDIRVKLIVDDPRNTNFHRFSDFANDVAGLQRTLGLLDDADRTMKRAFELLEDHMAKYQDSPGWPYGYRWEFGHAGRFYGFYLGRTGRPKEAIMPFEKAAAAFAKLVEEAPDRREYWDFWAGTYRAIADTYLSIQAPAEADASMCRLVKIHEQRGTKLAGGQNVVVWTARGDYYASRKQWDKAIADYSRAVELKPTEPGLRDRVARSHHTFAELLAQKKQFQHSIKEFREAIAGWEKLAADIPTRPEFRQHAALRV